MIIDRISGYFIQHNLIEEDELPMFRYCVEKRIFSAIAFIPLFILGIIWTNVLTTISFLGAFSYLRSTTNGFHANKAGTCFFFSILIEFIIFRFVIAILTPRIILVSLILSLVTIFFLAPYNHPNMALTCDEIRACRVLSRKRAIILLIAFLVSNILALTDVAIGLFLGIALVSVLLCLAYISNWGEIICLTKKRHT